MYSYLNFIVGVNKYCMYVMRSGRHIHDSQKYFPFTVNKTDVYVINFHDERGKQYISIATHLC